MREYVKAFGFALATEVILFGFCLSWGWGSDSGWAFLAAYGPTHPTIVLMALIETNIGSTGLPDAVTHFVIPIGANICVLTLLWRLILSIKKRAAAKSAKLPETSWR